MHTYNYAFLEGVPAFYIHSLFGTKMIKNFMLKQILKEILIGMFLKLIN